MGSFDVAFVGVGDEGVRRGANMLRRSINPWGSAKKRGLFRLSGGLRLIEVVVCAGDGEMSQEFPGLERIGDHGTVVGAGVATYLRVRDEKGLKERAEDNNCDDLAAGEVVTGDDGGSEPAEGRYQHALFREGERAPQALPQARGPDDPVGGTLAV